MIYLLYFGYVRKAEMYIVNPLSAIDTFRNLPKSSNNRVVLTMFVTKENINNVKVTINSILDQDVRVDMLYIIKSNDNNFSLPPYLENIAYLIDISKNYGNGNSLIPLIFKEKQRNVTIISITPGTIYPRNFIKKLVHNSVLEPNTIFKGSAYTLVKPDFFDMDVISSNMSNLDTNWYLNYINKDISIKQI
jgi:hypothetical protein